MARYTKKIVVFLDILGFTNKLHEFEDEALENEIIGSEIYHQSIKLNEVLDLIDQSVKLLNHQEYKCYLFSDNICFTIGFVDDGYEDPDLFIKVLLLVNILFKDFLQIGYLLRGGIDVGWFLEDDLRAIGLPLVKAYNLESKIAIYPRVLLSNKFMHYLKTYATSGRIDDDLTNKIDKLIYNDRKTSFLNSFSYIFEIEDKNEKLEYLTSINNRISASYRLLSYKGKKIKECHKIFQIKKKYKWFIKEYNEFLELYYINFSSFEMDGSLYNGSDIEILKNLKIKL